MQQVHEVVPIENCESIIAQMPNPPAIEHTEASAYYQPSKDTVNVPPIHLFKSAAAYYSTFFHELTHSTGHESRLNRKSVSELSLYGSHDYSKEELIAEIGSCFLCNHAGIEQATFENSAAYISGWTKKLQDDQKLVVHAAASAHKAVDFILGKKQGNDEQA